MPIRTALAISFSLHLLLLSPWNALHFSRIEDREDQIEVTYILNELDKEEIDEIIENIPENYGLEKEELTESPGEKPPAPSETPQDAPVEKNQYVEEEDVKELEGYIAYYELIRQKIKGRVTALYKRAGEEGRVGVAFILNRRGVIKKFEIDDIRGSDKRYLEKIARQAVKSAAPFPPFPDELQKPELTFTVAIIFTRDR